MKLFRFDASVGHAITQFGSGNVVMSGIQRADGQFQLGCMHVGPGGIVGYHQATEPQLFLVVAGKGWVRGERAERYPISAGYAAYWQAGEWHESGTDTGMMAMVLESPSLEPARFMTEVD